MQAMDPAAADLYEEDGKDLDFYDFEPLPTLPEDEENVSLADILSLRDRGLSEQEAWAVCLECSLSMRSVAHAAIFQSLCITPDTLAFNTSGNVCFMEQLSDDPEGAFVPPEFDVTGNTFEAHIYSLGATLKAALEYVAEPTLELRLSQDLEALLSQMQAEDPGDRPDLESIIALCEEKLQLTSSSRVCRSLSAVGRRVLSIESFGALQDVSESSWRERPVTGNTGPRRPSGNPSADPEVLPAPKGSESEASRGPRTSPTKALLSTLVRNGESHSREELASLVLDAERTLGDLDRDALRRSRLRKVQTFPRLLSDSPEATPCLPLTRGKSQLPISELFPPDPRKAFLDRKNGLSSFQAQPKCRLWPEQELEHQLGGVPCAGHSADRGPGAPGSPGQPETSHLSLGPAEAGPPACPAHPRDASGEAQTPGDDERIPEGARQLESAAAEQWVSLQDLLSQLGRPFREYELWALCLACLRALQMHPEHPAYLCLDSVLVAEDGAVLFQPPPANGSYDSFFLAPELVEERLVTEKASVYCVAAVLWTAAKFSVPRNHKLALPRRLKTLLLDMARRSAPERPSAAEAIKVCSSYLLQRGMDSRKILAHLRASTRQVYQEEETISLQNAFSVVELKPSVAPVPEPSPGGGLTSPCCPTGPCTPHHSCHLCMDRHSRAPPGNPGSKSRARPAWPMQPSLPAPAIPLLSQNSRSLRPQFQVLTPISQQLALPSPHLETPLPGSTQSPPTPVLSPPQQALPSHLVRPGLSGLSPPPGPPPSTSHTHPPIPGPDRAQRKPLGTCGRGRGSRTPGGMSRWCGTCWGHSARPHPQPPGSPGFLPVNSDTRLVAVPGPVPSQRPCCEEATQLPAAFTSEATHFKPIVLAQDAVMARDQPALAQEESQERGSQREGDGEEKLSPEALARSPSLKTPDGPAPGPGSQGAAPELPGESAQHGPAQGCPCPPPRAPANQPEEASSAAPSSPVPSLPMKASALPERPGPSGQAPPGVTSGGLRPDALGPITAHHGPRHPPKPPRSKATERPGQDPGERDDQSPDGVAERPRPADRRPCLPCVDASPLPGRTACPSLKEATRLIQEEFAFDGYLDNGLEALIMGEYIFALKDLTFATFCGAISEKFCDLYWDEKLLQNLFRVVNGQASPSPSTVEDAGSQLEGSRSPRSPSSRRPSLHPLGKEKPAMARTSSSTLVSDVDSEALSRGNFEVGFRPQRSVKAERAQQPEVGEDRRPAGGASDAEAVTRLARSKGGSPALSPGPAGFQSCSPGWCSAFYEADCFGADVHNYVKDLGRQQVDGALPDAQSPELEQQLMMEKRNYRKTLKFYQKLLQKEKRNKGSDVKTMLSKLKGQLEEMKSRVQFLSLVKKYLQVLYAERWGLEPCALPVIVNIAAAPCDTLDFSPLDESSSLIFYNVNKHPGGRQKARILQAGTPLGLMAYLYSSDAFLEGYVQQFLYTFRYFCTPQDFLHFLLDRINSTLTRAHQDPTSTFTKIYRRSLCVLQAWVEDCYAVDFTRNSGLLGKLEDFISSKILPLDGSAKHLLGLLEVGTDRRAEGSPRSTDLENPREAEEDARPFNALCKRLSEDGISRKSFPWRLPRGNGLVLPPHKERPYTIAAALPKPCFLEDFYGPCAKTSEKGPYFLTEYSTHQLFSQLTLLQQELFQKCHPVHFLNSRALGVMDKSTAIPKASSSESLSAKTCSLFLPNYVQDKYLLQLLRNADDVSTWVAAEIVTSHTSKLQVNLLSKFLLIAKSCYEQRNFATAMQILSGLEHLAVRQSPAWRILPAKIAEVMEELKAVEVFLKSDSLCLMEGRRFRAQPTLPSAHLLAMHIQQLETGGFTMTNGAHRWSKLRNIAKVVSQVHAFQENPYTFSPDPKLQSYLKQRIARFSGADISTLAADSRANFHQVSSEKHSRKIQDKLRRMKATFQ